MMQKQLQDGLILRSLSEGVASDRKNMGAFYERVFGENGDEDSVTLTAWTHDLIADSHPTTALDDLWVVVDPAADDKIVSALLLIPQTWRYDDVEFGLGRVELVATDKDYRRRGLVRELMHAAHERSESLGHLVQGITGIPHYYRQFGYAMAVELGSGSAMSFDAITPLKDDQEPDFTVRLATPDDAPQLVAWDNYYAQTRLLSTVRDEAQWRYEIDGRGDTATFKANIGIIVNKQGEDVGYAAVRVSPENDFCGVFGYVVGEKSSYLATFDDVMRWCKHLRDTTTQKKPSTTIRFDSGVHETVHELARRSRLGIRYDSTYAWYLRVPDLPAFIQHIRPVLERRLAGSGANRYTGELKLEFYPLDGLTFTFENGRLTDVKGDQPESPDATFPYHTFYNVLFGHHTRAELFHVLKDATGNVKADLLLKALFPPQKSYLYALT